MFATRSASSSRSIPTVHRVDFAYCQVRRPSPQPISSTRLFVKSAKPANLRRYFDSFRSESFWVVKSVTPLPREFYPASFCRKSEGKINAPSNSERIRSACLRSYAIQSPVSNFTPSQTACLRHLPIRERYKHVR